MPPVIHTIDLKYLGISRAIASFVVMGSAGPVLVEAGPASTLDTGLAGLDALGLKPDDIKHVLVSHIHLDHAGAAGWWATQGAQVYVHAFGARHLVDPSKLMASATRIYGKDMDRLWGPITPAPADQVTPLEDGDVVEIGDLQFEVIETPGHARHHHAFALGDQCFTGDAAAMVVPDNGFIALPTPPPEFDLEEWLDSIERLRERNFATLHLTHFGAVHEPTKHLDRLAPTVRAHASFVREAMDQGRTDDETLRDYSQWYRRQSDAADVTDAEFNAYVSRHLLAMNVAGLWRYWEKRAEQART